MIDDAFRYDFDQGPKQVRSREDALRGGNNCVALAHLALGDIFGRELDPSKHCYEMFSDREQFATVTAVGDMRLGDLAWFGVSRPPVPIEKFEPEYDGTGYLLNWQDFAVNHVAIYTGLMQDGEPLFLHASPTDGTNVIWPLSRFAEHSRYEQIHRISRLIIDN